MRDPKTGLCNCWFCKEGKQHGHSMGYDKWDIGGRLLVAESLDPKDIQPTKTCQLCGHTEDLVEEGGTSE